MPHQHKLVDAIRVVNVMFTFTEFMAFICLVPATANNNGLALTPPLGWRSWNLFGHDVNQSLIENIMDGMVKRTRRDHLGQLSSLCDLGYCDVGLDDNWQDCNHPSAAPHMHYHDKEGNPIVDLTLFPDLKRMTDHAHYLNLTAGWYGNNCICKDQCETEEECKLQMKGDVKALVKYNFDSWKLDGCGGENDLVLFNSMIMEMADRPIVVENCHWGNPKYDPDNTLPPALGCPYNFYRTSGDIRPSYESILSNLATVEKYHSRNQSYPGCWAYPDMLQVGVENALTAEETRSHFGSWAIISSPLILSHDVNDDVVTDQIWDVISNREVLAVNQAYAGDSGGVYEKGKNHRYFSKPIDGGSRVALLLMNTGSSNNTLMAKFEDIPGLSCEVNKCAYHVRDIWNHKNLGIFETLWSVSVKSHDAAFVVVDRVHKKDVGIAVNS